MSINRFDKRFFNRLVQQKQILNITDSTLSLVFNPDQPCTQKSVIFNQMLNTSSETISTIKKQCDEFSQNSMTIFELHQQFNKIGEKKTNFQVILQKRTTQNKVQEYWKNYFCQDSQESKSKRSQKIKVDLKQQIQQQKSVMIIQQKIELENYRKLKRMIQPEKKQNVQHFHIKNYLIKKNYQYRQLQNRMRFTDSKKKLLFHKRQQIQLIRKSKSKNEVFQKILPDDI